MAQIATVSATDNLFTYNPKSFTFNVDSHKAEALVNELASDVTFIHSATAFFYNGRLRLNITPTTGGSLFVLLKGLIEFHRPKDFLFSYDKSGNSIEADIHEYDFASLKKFLVDTDQSLEKEIRFKSALKKAIAFEAKYQADKKAIYASLVK